MVTFSENMVTFSENSNKIVFDVYESNSNCYNILVDTNMSKDDLDNFLEDYITYSEYIEILKEYSGYRLLEHLIIVKFIYLEILMTIVLVTII